MRFYLVPAEVIPSGGVNYCGPLYFAWRSPVVVGSGTLPRLGHADYSFIYGFLVLADLDATQHADLMTHADVYAFPEDLDQAITDKATLQPIFEALHIPADWITPSSTYRELLRRTQSMFWFVTRFKVRARMDFFSSITLDMQYRDWPTAVQDGFNATLVDKGIDPSIVRDNMTVRQMLKAASDYMARPFRMGGSEW